MKPATGFAVLLFAFSLFSLFTFPLSTEGYIETSSGPELIVELTPQNPGSNADVTAKLQSFALDISNATISWYQNGIKKASGIALMNFRFRTGEAGKSSTLDIKAETPEGLTAEKTLVINPADVDLVWEATTYTPPKYAGKALPTPGSEVRIVALPNFASDEGGALHATDLTYNWEKDFIPVLSLSGRGKQSFAFTMPSGLAETNISVRVSAPDGSTVAENRLTLKPSAPLIRFYEEHPLLGTLYGRALGPTLSLRRDEFTLRAEPFGMYASGEPLSYNWRVDSEAVIPHGEAQNLLTLRLAPNNSGKSSLSLAINNVAKALSAVGKLAISFGK